MDSVTQILLGSAVAGAVAPKGCRKRAIVAGAVLGTLPDLDVFVPYDSPIDSFTQHRTFTHSLFVLPLFSLLLLPVMRRLFAELSWRRLYVLTLLALVTHPLLDALTSYGTQLFWPITTPIYSASVFIVDPLYSLPLLVGLGAYWLTPRARWLNTTCLLIATLYLGLGLGMKQLAQQQLSATFPNTEPDKWFVGTLTASPMCWHGVYVEDDKNHYIETAFNILAPERMAVERYEVIQADTSSLDYQQLQRFNPNTVVRQRGERVISSDLRMGEFGNYLFEFVLAPREQSGQRTQYSQWQPSQKNAVAEHYRQINNSPSPVKRKLSQFVRCLGGGI